MTPTKRLSTILLLGIAASALPANTWADGDWIWHVNGGYADTLGKASDYLTGGWTFGGGFAFQPDSWEHLAMQVDFGYSSFGAKHNLITLANARSQYRIDDGHAWIGMLTAAGKYTVSFTDTINGYGLLGIGGYHRYVELTQTAIFGGAICDPWWGYCYPGLATGQALVANTSTTKFGWNAGLGVEFKLEDRGAFFVEARFHSMAGSEPTDSLPIQIGFRF
jgi:opacity protein-like surface antigen